MVPSEQSHQRKLEAAQSSHHEHQEYQKKPPNAEENGCFEMAKKPKSAEANWKAGKQLLAMYTFRGRNDYELSLKKVKKYLDVVVFF